MVAQGLSRRAGKPPGRPTRALWLRRAVGAVLIAAALALALLWPAFAADVDRLATRWPDTLPKDRRPPVWTPLDQIDPKLRWAVIAAEDANFWRHEGIDWDATVAAARRNLEVRRYAVGGSTLTQQLAKNLFLSRRKTLVRKAREAILAWRLERALTKRRILELYLNVAEWGDGVFGAEAAARHILGHSAARMTWGEAATLAAILPSPTNKLDPDKAPGRVRRRRAVVLNHLYRASRLSHGELVEARAAPLTAAEARATAAAEAREAAEERAAAGRGGPAAAPAVPPASEVRPAVGPSGAGLAGAPPAEDPALGRAVFETVPLPPAPGASPP